VDAAAATERDSAAFSSFEEEVQFARELRSDPIADGEIQRRRFRVYQRFNRRRSKLRRSHGRDGAAGLRLAWRIHRRVAGHLLSGQPVGSQVAMLYAISLLVVFRCLAALYESRSIALAVIVTVPVGILGGLGRDLTELGTCTSTTSAC